ncbi:hypothetical protein ES703_104255 [subsurface metagenome]
MTKLKPTTVVIPADITQKLKELKLEKNVATFWRAIEVYFDEKHKKEIQRLQTGFDKLLVSANEALALSKESKADTILTALPDCFARATIHVLVKKGGSIDMKKDASLIIEEVRKTFATSSPYTKIIAVEIVQKLWGPYVEGKGIVNIEDFIEKTRQKILKEI